MNHLSASTIERTIPSGHLHRSVTLSIILPPEYSASGSYKLFLCNDGQDFQALGLSNLLHSLQSDPGNEQVVAVGIHADHNRLQEYGTATKTDYAKRGSLAGATSQFVIEELIPFLEQNYAVKSRDIIYAGFSLGGLMALDIAWNYSQYFSKVAVLSGALWWRAKAIGDGYSGTDRIMHAQIRNCKSKPSLKFWFQTGTMDETDDRDGDGIIDSIQDTLECISELELKGYKWGEDISYLEVKGGEHNIRTWASVIPDFYKWAFGKKDRL